MKKIGGFILFETIISIIVMGLVISKTMQQIKKIGDHIKYVHLKPKVKYKGRKIPV